MKLTKKQKKNLAIGIIIFIVGIFVINYLGLLSLLPTQGTAYSQTSFTKDTITYSRLWNNIHSGFRVKHFLAASSDMEVDGGNFELGYINKNFFRFYLEYNGIDSSQFNVYTGRKVSGVFSPRSLPGPFHDELEALGFAYHLYRDTKEVFVGDQTPCCGSSGCCATYFVHPDCCYAYKQTVVVSEEGYWTGNYKSSVLNQMAEKMICEVKGTVTKLCRDSYMKPDRCQVFNYPYSIKGKVTYSSGNAFMCTVNKSEIMNKLPETFVRPIDGEILNVGGFEGIGTVTFSLAKEIIFHRLQDNQCIQISILETEKTINDYYTLAECNSARIKRDYYRFQDNKCVLVNLYPSEKTINDYYTLEECEANIIIVEECLEGDLTYYTCPDGTEIIHCVCVDRTFDCITSPISTCPEEGECTVASDCEGKPHIVVPGEWICEDEKCIWAPSEEKIPIILPILGVIGLIVVLILLYRKQKR